MKTKIISIALALALLLTSVPPVSALEHGMTDISGHWAEEDIAWVLDMGLFNGISQTEFNPDGSMTRGMFVTVLGRFAGIDPADYEDWYLPYLYSDVNSEYYYAPYINWATRYGITTGIGDGTFHPDQPINREQMATFLVRFANRFGYLFIPIRDEIPDSFADSAAISGYALEAVEEMRRCGLLNGRINADGTYNFDPLALAARSECAAVFHRLYNSLTMDENYYPDEPSYIDLYDTSTPLFIGDQLSLYCRVDSSNNRITWVSSDPAVAIVDSDGKVTGLSEGTVEIYAYTCNGLFDMVEFPVGPYIGYEDEGYSSKCRHIFGKYVDNPRKPYGYDAPKSAYEENYVNVTVKVWDFKKGIGSEKVTKNRTFYVHKNLELTVKKIFEEIYACEEKYPINSIVTYWSDGGNSEHNPGTAIDINPDENPYVAPDGTVVVGKEFDPENNPYSIPVDGEIQQIFAKYGFTRGIYWGGYVDYMHFSFFGL